MTDTDRIKSISPNKIMKSRAGYYIGRTCIIENLNADGRVIDEYTQPYDRLTDYYDKRQDAALQNMNLLQSHSIKEGQANGL